jgi:hypothetical protein
MFDKKLYASLIQELTLAKFHDHTNQVKFSSAVIISSIFSGSSGSPKSSIPEKSGRIINTVGKSVSLFTISSICLVTHHIKKSGNAEILLFCT